MPRQQFNFKKKATSDENNIKISNLIIFLKKEVKLNFFHFFLEEHEELRTMCSSFLEEHHHVDCVLPQKIDSYS